jgi:hypothetical protein
MNLINETPVSLERIVGVNRIPNGASILNNFRDPTKTTERYVETDDLGVVQVLNDHGWFVSNYQQMSAHCVEKAPYKQYMATYRNPELPKLDNEADLTILQRGSKDGTKRFVLDVGLFRFACLNGMVTGERLFKPVVIKHIGDVPNQLGYLLDQVNEAIPLVYGTVKEMSVRDLSEGQQFDFARKAVALRFKEDKNGVNIADVLKPRRTEDAGNSLWKVLNRLQENLIKGGTFIYTTKDNKQRHSKAIKNIDLQYDINVGLWDIAESYLN